MNGARPENDDLPVDHVIKNATMKAARVHHFGSPDVIVVEDVPRPVPGEAEVLIRVSAAGVGPWDALIREGKSKVSPPPPLTLGSDLSGIVASIGPGVTDFKNGDEVYGVTNPQFCGAYAEYALAFANMIASKPRRLGLLESASVPVVAVTAWQMLFEYAQATAGQTALILGGAGNVGACAVQLAHNAGIHVIATAGAADLEYARSLGADQILDYRTAKLEDHVRSVDMVIDTVGGEPQQRAFGLIRSGGTLVSVVSRDTLPQRADVKSVFFYVEVTTARLNKISELIDQGKLIAQVGTALPLDEARAAHLLLAGAPHKRGKIVLFP